MVPLFAQAQDGEWTRVGIFPADSSLYGASHGIAVDGEGKIWTADFYQTGSLLPDSSEAVVDVRVFNPDGTEADFSPVQQVTINDVQTIFKQGRGMRADADGNILYADGATLIRINHQTGEGMNRVFPGIGSLTTPAVDAAGNVYVSAVLPGNPIKQYSADMDTTDANGEVVIDEVPGYGRTFEVSKDGNTVYAPRYDLYKLLVYNRTDLTPFGAADTVLEGANIESIALDPHSQDVWVSAYTDIAPDSARNELFALDTWYGYDTETWEQVDSVAWVHDEDEVTATQPPRGMAFSNDANTIYLAKWRNNVNLLHPIQSFTRNTPVSNEREVATLPEGYSLEQNYPNPFNPTTNINYTIKEAGNVSLKVYDITGREVVSLVNNERLSAGNHTVTFDASNLASGVYIYALDVNGLRLTNRMTLIK
ncbi:MAG: T9SS type A sorting domain-containing protein [Balneolaceae bacterium]